MTLEEFKEKAKDEEWAPGWDEIECAFREVYGDAEPSHFATLMPSRAIFGGKMKSDTEEQSGRSETVYTY